LGHGVRPKREERAGLPAAGWAKRKRETGLAARTSVGGGFHFSFLFSRILNQPFQKEFETLFKSYKNQSNIIKYASACMQQPVPKLRINFSFTKLFILLY